MKPLMELLKQFFIQRIILYAFIAFFSFFVIVPLGDLRIKFTDDHCSRCLLYSDVVYNVSVSPDISYFRIRFGEQEVCEYSIAVTSVLCLIYPLVVGGIYFYLYRRDSAETRDENKLDLGHCLFLVHVLLEVAFVLLILVSASMISRGFQHLCESLGAGRDLVPPLLDSCSDAQNFHSWRGYDGSNFYVTLSVATAGSWFLFLSWLLQALLGLWKLWRLNMLPVLPLGCLPCCDRGE
ncbi:uncharacterized protein LOC101860766 [Aplysia californica]|uniref:Uncharacterized protein LOC101860766 n=1 Tax=Aplysia californica TaxID=6500 RepID=A0ABM0K2F2_APLCA|nr:uncharacterized protein LOC101860766 [Aplysia californica]